jgi:hypothetical protein
MKTKLILLVMYILSNTILVRSQTLGREVRNDFCVNAKYNYFYGTNSFFGLMNLTLKRIGISDPYKMDEAVRNICSNESLQNSFFENVYNVSKGLDKQQYLSMGMKYNNVEKLIDYMALKNPQKEQNNLPRNTIINDDLVNESNKIDRKQLLQSIYPKSVFINDSTVLRKESFTNENFKEVEIEFKTVIAKEYSYTDEKNDENRIKILFYSKKEKEIAFFDILIMTDLGEKGYKSIENTSFKRRRLYIDKSKRNISGFETIKEYGKTYFVVNYTDENNNNMSDYYTIDLKLIKTLIKNEFVQDVEIVKSILKEDLKKIFLPKKLTNSKQLFSVSNFKYRMINLIGSINYNFIENICVNETNITDDSNYLTLRGFREKGYNTKNKDNYIIAIDPKTQILFVGIRKDDKILLYGEEKVFPNEIYQWKLIEENIR